MSTTCSISPGFSEVPEIEFIAISKDTISQGALLSDSLFIVIKFRDGDGDLGTENAGLIQNIELTDSRTGDRYSTFRIPPLDIAGAKTGIEGDLTMKIFNTCCIFPDGSPPCGVENAYPFDALTLDIQLKDDSGNLSNVITTPRITLICD